VQQTNATNATNEIKDHCTNAIHNEIDGVDQYNQCQLLQLEKERGRERTRDDPLVITAAAASIFTIAVFSPGAPPGSAVRESY